MAAESKHSGALTSPGFMIPFITVTALFFVFGFITNLNMALVPQLRRVFTLPHGLAMLAESAFFLAYFVFAGPTGKLIETIGYKKTMVVSLFIQVVGCLLFVPAAKLVNFPGLIPYGCIRSGRGHYGPANRGESVRIDPGA